MPSQLKALVLGSAAGGGFPQWNCRCPICDMAWNNDPRVTRRTQSSIAVSGADGAWMLFNASPDLRQQILSLHTLQPANGMRHTPIKGVFITNGDVDHVAGLLTLREQQPFRLYGSRQTLQVLADSQVFNVVNKAVVDRVPIELGVPLATDIGFTVTAFAVPGKVPLFMEGERVEIGAETESTVGLEVAGHGHRLFYIPGCAHLTEALLQRVEGADAVLFDGTTFTDDEMVTLGLSPKTAGRMGHIQISGADGSLQRLASAKIGRKIYIHINNTNPILVDGSPQRQAVEAAGWEVAYDGMEIDL